MHALEYFELRDGHAEYRPVAKVSLQGGVHLISQAIRYAGQQQVKRLLIDSRELTGFNAPTTSDRYSFARKWAGDAAPGLRLAMIARPELIDPEKFGVTVARNAGLEGNVFSTEAEARAWLLGEPAA